MGQGNLSDHSSLRFLVLCNFCFLFSFSLFFSFNKIPQQKAYDTGSELIHMYHLFVCTFHFISFYSGNHPRIKNTEKNTLKYTYSHCGPYDEPTCSTLKILRLHLSKFIKYYSAISIP